MSTTEITDDRYDHYLNCMPPIYFTQLDGEDIKGGFCVAEAFTHTNEDVPVFTACFKFEGKLWETLVTLKKATGEYIREYNSQQYTRDNHATSY